MVHVTSTSTICKFNLLMRGPVTSAQQDTELQDLLCKQRRANARSGMKERSHVTCCTNSWSTHTSS